MKYRDYKLGFNVEVPDYFSEVKEASFEVFGVAPSTLKYFILLDDKGEIMRTCSIVRSEEKVKSDKEFEEFVKANIKTMEEGDFIVLKHTQRTTDSGKTIERYVFMDQNMEESLGVLMYFMRVKDEVIVSSTYIVEFFDEYEEELFNIFNSIEEI